MYLLYNNFSHAYPLHHSVISQAVEQLNLADNLSSKCVEMLDEVLMMIKKLTGANVEHAALIANSKILTLFSRFAVDIYCTSLEISLSLLKSIHLDIWHLISKCYCIV